MCGIAGVVVPDLATSPGGAGVRGGGDVHAGGGCRVDIRAAVRALTAALVHRGPDGEGYHFDRGVGLGHRRLAVIDVAGGAQPLYAAGGSVVGVVNGEIYNFRDLRRQLESYGHRFATGSDSEVVVHGYAQWGVGVLGRLDGQFALAVWDARDRSLLLARDRMGLKPLLWAPLVGGGGVSGSGDGDHGGGGVAFASDLRALQRCRPLDGIIDTAIDPASLARYLVYEYVPAPRTILRGVYKLPPGCALRVRPGRPPAHLRYWQLPLPVRRPDGLLSALRTRGDTDLDRAAADLRDVIDRAVRRRLVADVPLGVFASGGLDSSLVAAFAARARGGDLDTFSIGFDDPSYDETVHARRIAHALGTRHHVRVVTAAEVQAHLADLGALLDEPLGDASIVPTHILSRFAREHVTVALGGDGGDELFCGYPTFQAEAVAGRVFDLASRAGPLAHRASAVIEALIRAVVPVSTANFATDFVAVQLMRGLGERGPRRHQAWLASLLPRELPDILADDVRAHLSAADPTDRDPYADIARMVGRREFADPADYLLAFYARGYLADDILPKVDRASMRVALEVRAPLLDRDVVAFACRAAPGLRMRGVQTKRLLKRAARGVVPDDIIDRRKHGFGLPLAAWLRGPLAEFARDVLSPARLRRDGLLSPAGVGRLLTEHATGRANHRKPLWTLLALHQWLG